MTRIIIFAKAPRPNEVKTRLISALGADSAAELARQMLYRTIDSALRANVGPVELCASPPGNQPAWSHITLPDDITITDQAPGDLGARLSQAAARALADSQSVLLIGTDCPALDAHWLQKAAAELTDKQATLITTYDGGYALLGLRQFDGSLFDSMPWSTAALASQTTQQLLNLHWRFSILGWLPDIDTPPDLEHLPPELASSALYP